MVRQFALVFGVVYLLVGVLGVVQTGMDAQPESFLGFFPVNGLHNVVHLLIGILGIAAYIGGEAISVQYAKWIGVVLILLGIIGIFSPDGFGLVPLGGWDPVLHIGTGIVAIYFGFRPAPTRPMEHRDLTT
jgi:hypothetical protein